MLSFSTMQLLTVRCVVWIRFIDTHRRPVKLVKKWMQGKVLIRPGNSGAQLRRVGIIGCPTIIKPVIRFIIIID